MAVVRRARMWDLSPLRPNEYWDTCAVDWQEALLVQRAWQDGVDDANDEHAAKQDADAM